MNNEEFEDYTSRRSRIGNRPMTLTTKVCIVLVAVMIVLIAIVVASQYQSYLKSFKAERKVVQILNNIPQYQITFKTN